LLDQLGLGLMPTQVIATSKEDPGEQHCADSKTHDLTRFEANFDLVSHPVEIVH
jgi:hypothetical protein